MQRDLREVIASQARMLEAKGMAKAELPDSRLAEIYAAQLDEARQLLDRDPCFDWIEVRHADLIAGDPDATRAISRLLGLSRGGEAMNAVIDPSLYRSRTTSSGLDREA